MDFQKLQKELPKYQVRFAGLSLLPFFLKLEVWYLPLNKKVGEIIGNFGKVQGFLHIVEPNIQIELKNGEWKIQSSGVF